MKQLSGTISRKGLLLVVILMIAVIATISKDAIRSARDLANQRQCMKNLRELWVASTMYAQDYGGWMPVYTSSRVPSRKGDPLNGVSSPDKLYSSLGKYVSNQSVWFCPAGLSADKDRYADRLYDYRYTNYDFHFCKPGVVRTDGLHNISPDVMRIVGNSPNRWALIMDQSHFVTRAGGQSGGPHPDGTKNVIYLDGHTRDIKP